MTFLHGLRTAKYCATDLARAKGWYSDVLGFGPYFDEPFYVGFNVGGFELGIVPDEPGAPGSLVATWGVDDAHAAYARLLSMGATDHEPIQDVGEGLLIGAVKDPFGNLFGVVQNPYFKLAAP